VRPFNLIRYFTVASLLVIAVLALAIAWTFSANLERNLVAEAGLYAADIGHSLNRSIFHEFLLPRSETGAPIDLTDPAQLRQLDEIVTNRTRELRILTVNLFDASGTIIYSSKPDYIGYRSIDNPGLDSALAGGLTSLLKRAELEQHPIRPGHDLLESYAPLYELDPGSSERGAIIGVIELYQDARPITTKIAEGQREILFATVALMTVLFVALFEIVRRGHMRITELTAALAESNVSLTQRVRQRTREVERGRSERAELERQIIQSESLASLGEMAAGVAHEIRNPIGMISSSAQLLSRADGLSERDRELLGVIQAETERLNETISEFVHFASPPEPSLSTVEAKDLLERVRTMLRAEAERRGISLDVAECETPARVRVDPELLYRALANLVLNALQNQTKPGWVRLGVVRLAPASVAIRVADGGPGIPEDDLERIFQPFFSRREGGTGLGLSIVQRIVRANDGRIAVSSSPSGTVFTLLFPEADA